MGRWLISAWIVVVGWAGPYAWGQDDPLPSWVDGATKRAIVDVVSRATEAGGAQFVPKSRRIAVFDHDGTLWCEHPMYVQAVFALDRLKALAETHPEWKQKQPFQSALDGNLTMVALQGQKAIVEIVGATHAGMPSDDFKQMVADWLPTAEHPVQHRPYTQCVYQPMLELLEYLKAHEFQTYIVSAGGMEFVRVFSESVYHIPPNQVIGSSLKTRYELYDGSPVVMRLPEVDFVCEGPGKPVAIQRAIGLRPVIAFGNSDGDFEMLEYTTGGDGLRLGAIIHHTDAERESAYDRASLVGRLDRALTEAPQRKWLVVDMKEDWKQIFPDRK